MICKYADKTELMQRIFNKSLKTSIAPSAMLILLSGFLISSSAQQALALGPNEILVIANGNNPASVRIARHYCKKRGVPEKNILKLDLKPELTDDISRSDYEKLVARPVRDKLSSREISGRIKCLLSVYGVPFRVGPREMLRDERKNLGPLGDMVRGKMNELKEVVGQLEVLTGTKFEVLTAADNKPSVKKVMRELDSYVEESYSKIEAMEDDSEKTGRLWKWLGLYSNIYGKSKTLQTAKSKAGLAFKLTPATEKEVKESMKLFERAREQKWGFGKRIQGGFYSRLETAAGLGGLLLRLDADIGNIKGTETGASVDSELSMVMFDDYELYRQQPNELKDRLFWIDTTTIMVSRLDGPAEDIAAALVDKAVLAEKNGLKGVAYIDSGYSEKKKNPLYVEYDQSLHQTASLLAEHTQMKVVHEQTAGLFAPGECPNTAMYCGWYSLKRYVDAFDFACGAVGFHIASWEAVNLHDPQSTQWCPAMLSDGITATMGAVAEPYLAAFPKPDRFFGQLINGKCLAEAFYRTKPYNSWQMLLIGDPLYTPFKRVN